MAAVLCLAVALAILAGLVALVDGLVSSGTALAESSVVVVGYLVLGGLLCGFLCAPFWEMREEHGARVIADDSGVVLDRWGRRRVVWSAISSFEVRHDSWYQPGFDDCSGYDVESVYAVMKLRNGEDIRLQALGSPPEQDASAQSLRRRVAELDALLQSARHASGH